MHTLLKIVFILALVVSVIGGYLIYMQTDFSKLLGIKEANPVIIFNKQVPLRVFLAQTEKERIQGLSDRKELLEPTEGMLFIFPQNDYHRIWMKDMYFSIDIAWIDENGVIVDIAENVSPDTYPRIFEPQSPARYVVETRAYFFDGYSIKKGDTVELPHSK